MTVKIAVDPILVERYIMELARFGAVGESGVKRTVYSPEWVAATDQYARWCEDGGLRVRRDAVGNVWGCLDGSGPGGSIASGSHIDTQLPGGRYDGALGALAALIAIRTLKEQFGTPKRSLEAVAFCEEEGSRFPAANYWGSRAVTGRIAADEATMLQDYEGQGMDAAMRSVGLDPARIAQAARHDIDLVEVTGEANHAGACPMDLRHDPMAGAAEMISGLLKTAENMGRPAVTTIGRMQVEPNYSAIIPHKVSFTIDARHPDPKRLAELYSRHEQWLREVADRRGLQLRWTILAEHATCPCDTHTVQLLEAAAREQGTATMLMHSGAGHDSQVMAHIAKIAMIFVQSRAGRSHTPEEFTSIEHAVMGINVLAAGMYRMAYL